METEKKCPHCGIWTDWETQPTDCCTSCNEVLDEIALAEKTVREQKEQFLKKNDLLSIKETDGLSM
jgi:endogenous inhibitor of DNA gyrase (YacG/DUF329 family)